MKKLILFLLLLFTFNISVFPEIVGPACTSANIAKYFPSTIDKSPVTFTGIINIPNLDAVVSTASYATSAGNAATVTNGVYTNGSYSNPTWITSLDGGKISSAVNTANYVTDSKVAKIDINNNFSASQTITGTLTASAVISTGDAQVASTGAVLFGSGTVDGSWRIVVSGADLSIEKRISGVWVSKFTITENN